MKKSLLILNLAVFLASFLCLIYTRNSFKGCLTPEQRKSLNLKKTELVDTTSNVEILRKEYLKVINVYESSAELNHSAYEFILILVKVLMVISFLNLAIILIYIYDENRRKTKKQIS